MITPPRSRAGTAAAPIRCPVRPALGRGGRRPEEDRMHDELTEIDIRKMKEEIAERKARIPALREEVRRTREYGDLSENDEYRSAKREYNANNGRIRYLENMIATAVIITTDSREDEVGLFDEVDVLYPEDGGTDTVRIVTTLRNDVFTNNISKESPFGRALLGRRAGETVTVRVNDRKSYAVTVVAIRKGRDDDSLPIAGY